MMNEQPEALRLADLIELYIDYLSPVHERQAVKELRRLHAINGELLWALRHIVEECDVEFCEEDWVRFRAAIAKATGEVA